ncbi:sigma-54-dependent Fis family transcriptional regulator [Ruixingdingia sedimenti]|uniref:Sigma 54-interacting transcriptional regulator n=1 Tax=Ruixingdingia sedimenti TaxID=3073604 RepID=A0ABU1FBY8_9RHOB|nr:sigma 54-interacting transcriptional regulator [Xinfangfangia sp. LG-4]MDR5654423.1 sigma 54-interacting transcriptional regulator [Xinfangfangia sp. LG-4]
MAESIQKEDWERFRALGSVPPSLREIVFRSWLRSRDVAGIDSLRRAPCIHRDRLDGLRASNTRLWQAARTAVNRAGYMLDDAGAMVLLADRDGVILDAQGDTRVLSRGEENHLKPGGCWKEDAIGTNAIGTALHVAKPVAISGVEHFCEAIQRWSCAASPISNPQTGEVLGVINISTPSDENLRHGTALSVSLAAQIEEVLRGMELREQHRLVDHLLSRRGARGADIFLLNRYGQPIWASAPSGEAPERTIRPQGGDGDVRELAERMRNALPRADIDVVSDSGEPIGLIVTLSRSSRRGGAAQVGPDLETIAASGAAMAAICAEARRILATGVALLIKGPAGSGKETLARALHEAGPQAGLPVEVLDCSLLDEAGLREGTAAQAMARLAESGGTLILDEPAETPADLQPPLVQRLARLERGAERPVQVVCLSSVSLSGLLAEGRLRADLYFRLSGAVVRLPALAERRGDLEQLVKRFSEIYSDRRKGLS